MGRYDDIPLRMNRKGQRTLVSTVYPKISLSDQDKFTFPIDGERLDNVAFRYYGDASLWWVIAQANHIGKGTLVIENGIQLRIPTNI